MIVLMFYFAITIINGEKPTFTMLALATLIDMANCMAICFVNNMIHNNIARTKIDVVRELNKGKMQCRD